jgi:hypothetical protein
MAAAGKKDVAAPVVTTDEDFVMHLSKPGLRIVDVYAKFAGPCEPMVNIFKRIKLDYGDAVNFIQVS